MVSIRLVTGYAGLSQGSNLPGISAILPGSVSYDQDDRLSTEDYDRTATR